MMKRFAFANQIRLIMGCLFLLAVLLVMPAAAQQVNLPSELFVLTNEGRVERYGVNAVGATPVTPEDQFVIDFGLDALGERLAYRTETGVIILGLSGGSGVPLEGDTASVPPYRGLGDTIAWSPGGDALAYTTLEGLRIYMETGAGPVFHDLTEGVFLSLSWSPGGTFVAAEAEDNIWWIYRRNGNEMALASVIPSSIGTAWVSNAEIVFAPAEGGLKLMNLEAANAQTTLLEESVEYRLPFLNAEDQLVFFARVKNSPNIPEGSGEEPLGRVRYELWSSAAVAELYALANYVESQLPQVTAPLLLVYSQGDTTAKVWQGDHIAAQVASQHIERHTLEQSGHIVTQDVDRERVFAWVAEFVQQIASPPKP